MQIPTGVVTFLFTDIEGSTTRWERSPAAMRVALSRHDALLREAIAAHNGYLFKTVGDGFYAAFSSALEAVEAARDAQLALQAENWDEIGGLRVRMGLHTGATEEQAGDYLGPTVNRVSRLQSLAYGQQVLLSQATADRCAGLLPADLTLHDLGRHSLKDLQQPEQIWQLGHPQLPSYFPALRSLRAFPNNLPQQLNSFIGREEDVRAIKRSLMGNLAEAEQDSAPPTAISLPPTRLLTLMGSGGIGKTRLAIQSAAELIETFPDGVWLIELAPVTDDTLLIQTVAGTLGLHEEPGIPLEQAILDYCHSKRILLLLDNCEHLVHAAAEFADRLLRRCSTVSVLATSREALGIGGETRYRVPSLSLPNPTEPISLERLLNCAAVQLFVERATSVKSDFQLTSDNSLAVAQICRRLDGIPLATELAAARTRSMPVTKLASRLEEGFQLLTGGSRTVLPRHQTLRALIDWSYHLLTAWEQRLFDRLSVFAGGWTLEMAEAICAGEIVSEAGEAELLIADYEVLDLLTALVDKSLVIYDDDGKQGRYRMLETLREYGQERLEKTGERPFLQTRHRDYFQQTVLRAMPKLKGAEQTKGLADLTTEANNWRTALGWYANLHARCELTANDASNWLDMVCALVHYWYVRGPISEGREWLTKVIEANRDTPTKCARAHNNAGILANLQGDRTTARTHYQKVLAIFRDLEQPEAIAPTLNNLALVERAEGNFEQVGIYLRESLQIYQRLNSMPEVATTLANLGIALVDQQEHTSAEEHLLASLTLFRTLQNLSGIASTLEYLCGLSFEKDIDRARTYLIECTQLRRAQGNRGGLTVCLEYFARLALHEQRYHAAAAYFGTREVHRKANELAYAVLNSDDIERASALLRAQLGDELFLRIWEQGQQQSIEEAIDEALRSTTG